MSKEVPEIIEKDKEIQRQENEAFKRVGWAMLALNEGRYRMAELHLTEATSALQILQRLPGGDL